jgi:hypothetical protein
LTFGAPAQFVVLRDSLLHSAEASIQMDADVKQLIDESRALNEYGRALIQRSRSLAHVAQEMLQQSTEIFVEALRALGAADELLDHAEALIWPDDTSEC